jgi:NDP-sugar pyrophosphorylase family protein
MRAILLCAGLGVRLRPLTNEIPKPLLPLFGRPVAEYQLEAMANAGVDAVVVNLHHLPEAVRERFGKSYRGLNIYYSYEPEILGPTGGIGKALPMLGDGPVLVVNGDVVMDIDFRALLKYHEVTRASLTLAVGPGTDRPKLRAVGIDPGGRVRQLWGKPEWTDSCLIESVNLGAFVYERRVIEEYIPNNSYYDFRNELIPRLFESGEKVMAYNSDTYWSDIGTVESYIQAHLDVFAGGGIAQCQKAAASGIAACGEGFKQPVYIAGEVRIGEGTTIGPNVSLGQGCAIGDGVELANGVVLAGARITDDTKADHFVAIGDRIVK